MARLCGKHITYGDGNAIMILVADKMGLAPALVAEAKRLLEGCSIHPMNSAAMEREAVRVNDMLRHDAALIAQANGFAAEIAAARHAHQ